MTRSLTSSSTSDGTFRVKQDSISRQLLLAVFPLLRTFVGDPVDTSRAEAVARSLYPAVQDARAQSAALAASYYRYQRLEQLGLTAPSFQPTDTPPDYQLAYLYLALKRVLVTTERSDEDVLTEDSALNGVATVVRHGESASRDKIVGLSLADDGCVGWARKARGASSCPFCLMLISRGPVYRSQKSASTRGGVSMKAYHNACDCQAVPVFDKENFPGYQEYKAAERLWTDSTKGKGGKAAIAAFAEASRTP